MSTKIKREGTFMAYPLSSGVVPTKANGYPQFVAQFAVVQEYDFEEKQWLDISANDEGMRGFFVLAGKDGTATLNAKQISKALNWTSGSLPELANGDYSEVPVQIRIEHDSDNEKYPYGVNWIDHQDADPSEAGSVTSCDDGKMAELQAMYGNAFKSMLGGEKPKTVAGKPKKPAAPKTGKKASSPPKPPKKGEGDKKADKDAAKEAAKAAVEEKKARAAAAEQKAQPPKKPGPPKLPSVNKNEEVTEEGQTAIAVPDDCDQGKAWEICNEHIKDTDALTETWMGAVDELGGDEAVESDNGWGTIAQICIEKLS